MSLNFSSPFLKFFSKMERTIDFEKGTATFCLIGLLYTKMIKSLIVGMLLALEGLCCNIWDLGTPSMLLANRLADYYPILLSVPWFLVDFKMGPTCGVFFCDYHVMSSI